MGCPDWPTCFGKWIPPTSIQELPPDYKEQYAAFRDKKNQKFAKYLSLAGLDQTADAIRNDKSILRESDFNVAKTWVEYMNRVVGVTIGLLIIALFVSSWPLRKTSTGLFGGTLMLLILVIFQGWFGSIVVSTNLTAWTVTVHMFLAIVMVGLIVRLWTHSGASRTVVDADAKPWLLAGIVAFLLQIFLGTQVRETLDRLATMTSRENWIGEAGTDFIIHRSFSWVVILIQAGIYVQLRKTSSEKSLHLVSFLLILCSLLTGTAMAYFGVPPVMQPIHLLVAIVSVGWMYQVYLQANNWRETAIAAK